MAVGLAVDWARRPPPDATARESRSAAAAAAALPGTVAGEQRHQRTAHCRTGREMKPSGGRDELAFRRRPCVSVKAVFTGARMA